MTGTRNIRRAFSFGKGPFFRYAGIIIVTICVFAVPRAGADTTATVYTNRRVRLDVRGNGAPVFFSEHLTGTIASDIRNRVRDAYYAVEPNPYLAVRYDVDIVTAYFHYERIPYVTGLAACDSAFIAFELDSAETGMRLYRLDGMVWSPVACSVVSAAGIDTLRARIADDGFYVILMDRAQEFGFDEYLSSYPNPFRPPWEEATVTYLLAADADVEIRICTRTGGLVRTMNFASGEPGGRGSGDGYYLNRVAWDGRNERGRLVEGGGYYCRLIVKDRYYLDWKIGVRR